jgi:predicted lipopolysaccharide heptosyltransferase III
VRILLLQLRRLGDLILTTPAVAAIRAHDPKAQIVLAVARECEPLLPAIPEVHQFIITKRGLRDLRAWIEVRRGCFDWTIDLSRNDRSAWLTLLSGAPKRVVSNRLQRKSRVRARFYNKFVDCAMKEMHTIDYYLALLQPLGITSAMTDLSLELPDRTRTEASEIIANQIGNQPFAVFHPGSAREEKFWEPERWAEVIRFAAQDLGLRPVLSGGNRTKERVHLAAIRERLRIPVTDLSAKIDLLTLAAVIEQARLLVSVDSAPTHLASAAKTPQVILFGPTNPFHWRPRNSPAAVLFGSSAEPLRKFESREPKRPMNQISTAAVIDAIGSMLSAPAASAV